jgi:hypothetical protein
VVGAEAREQFTGWIAGMGTASGCPAGDRPLAPLPCGVVTDVRVEDPAGHRTLYAPTPELAEFLVAAYAFDGIHHPPAVAGVVASASARRAMARSCATP